ncbi:Os03g0617500 [Oryza sativa Japonica Group]|uniref:Os03g0617500 protein n=1 Tax=Oryza sativa subsp. japonica TaxID=39947 RepID=A0A0P0W140_ORYSJ|nr:hypothetical protein EE612_018944 [Oryza sativa]BAS85282.1 Os03g0617500 [Oryza sativa Japonica Group]
MEAEDEYSAGCSFSLMCQEDSTDLDDDGGGGGCFAGGGGADGLVRTRAARHREVDPRDARVLRILPPHGVPGHRLLRPFLPPAMHRQVGDAVGGAAAGGGVRVAGGEDGGVPGAGAVGVPRRRRRRRLRVQLRLHPPHGAARALHARLAHGRRHAVRLPPLPLLQAPATRRRRRRRGRVRRPHLLRRRSGERARPPAVHGGRRRGARGDTRRADEGGIGVQDERPLPIFPPRQGGRVRVLQRDAEPANFTGEQVDDDDDRQEIVVVVVLRVHRRREFIRRHRRLLPGGGELWQQEDEAGAAGRHPPMSGGGGRDTHGFCPSSRARHHHFSSNFLTNFFHFFDRCNSICQTICSWQCAR